MDVDNSCCVAWIVVDDVCFFLVCESVDFRSCETVLSVLYVFGMSIVGPYSVLTHSTAPAAKAVKYDTVKFNATMGEGSPYVGKGPEVDAAWHAISYDIGDQMITPEELKIIGMPETSLKVKNPKTGVEGYRVGLEVFHQLHCINLLRQVTYKDYYTELGNGNFASGDEELQMHTGMFNSI
jgi:hypothetical protein